MRRSLLPLSLLAVLLWPAACNTAPHVSADLVYRHSVDVPPTRLRPGWNRVWVGRERQETLGARDGVTFASGGVRQAGPR